MKLTALPTSKRSIATSRTPQPSAAKSSGWKPRSRWQKVGDYLLDLLVQTNDPKIRLKRDRDGIPYWDVCDPVNQTRAQFYSEAEVRAWLEQRYYR
jgi:hypothetical protein